MSPCWYVWSCRMVALLAEGVDRNPWRCVSGRNSRVALLAEGVDRNDDAAFHAPTARKSPSSRRAWIEMLIARMRSEDSTVALLAEGVDRNTLLLTFDVERDSRPPRGGRG